MTKSQRQHGIGSLAPGEKIVGKPGGLVEPGIMKYGMLDFITEPLEKLKDKFVDDIIPNEIKENPLLTAALVGGGINQFGLPSIPGLDTKGMGQNWLGDLLGGVMPGDTQFNTVLGDTLPFMFQDTTTNPLPGGLDQLYKDVLAQDMSGIMGDGRSQALQKIAGIIPDVASSVEPSGISIRICISLLLSNGRSFRGTSRSRGRSAAMRKSARTP